MSNFKRNFYHTGLEASREDIRALLDHLNPSKKLFVMKGSGVASPVGGVYEAGSDANDGLTWGTAFASIAKAIAVASAYTNWSGSPWASNVEIHIAPGKYDEYLTAMPHGCRLIGHGECWDADGETGVLIAPTASLFAADNAVNVGAWVNGQCINIGFYTPSAVPVFDCTILNNVLFHHCRFAGPPESTVATAGIYTSDSVMLTVRDCRFEYLDCGIDFVYADGGDSMTRALIDGNFFTYISEAGIRISTNLVTPASLIINNFINGGGGTLAVGIDDNSGQDDVGVWGNFIDATDAIQGITANVGGNYIGGSNIE